MIFKQVWLLKKFNLKEFYGRCTIRRYKTGQKPPKDGNQLAMFIADNVATDELLQEAVQNGKNPAAVMLGRLGGLKSGKARAVKLQQKRGGVLRIDGKGVNYEKEKNKKNRKP